MKILLGYQSYGGESQSAIGQRLVNMYAEKNPDIAGVTASAHKGMQFMVGSKYPWTLFGTPGQKRWLDTGTGSNVQGMQVMGGNLYVVAGNNVIKVTPDKVTTNLGLITGQQLQVDMANNGTQLGIVSSDTTGWVATSSALVKITDGNFPGASSICYLQGFGIFSTPNSQQMFLSKSYDLTAYTADFASVISSSSNLVRVSSFNNGVWLFTSTSYEVWGNNGASPIPYQIIGSDSNSTRGIVGKFAVTQDANSMYILADDGIVYSFVGFTPQRVSQHGVEAAIQKHRDNGGISDVLMMTYTQRGHKFMCMIFPTQGATWVFDITQGLWHERETYGSINKRWTVNCIVEFAGKILVGDYADGHIYELDLDTFVDDDVPIQRIMQGAVTWEEANRITHDMVRLDIDAGVGLDGIGQGTDPQVIMQYSDDGGKTWSNERWKPIGKIGEFKNQCVWRRNGQSRQRIYRFMITDPVAVKVNGAYANVRIGKN